MDEDPAAKASRRQRHVDETSEILARIAAASLDDFETMAELHELHARHERAVGHEENARLADGRAAKARARMTRDVDHVEHALDDLSS